MSTPRIPAARRASWRRTSATSSSVVRPWRAFQNSLDSPRAPGLRITTRTVAPCAVYLASVPPARTQKSAACALTHKTRSVGAMAPPPGRGLRARRRGRSRRLRRPFHAGSLRWHPTIGACGTLARDPFLSKVLLNRRRRPLLNRTVPGAPARAHGQDVTCPEGGVHLRAQVHNASAPFDKAVPRRTTLPVEEARRGVTMAVGM